MFPADGKDGGGGEAVDKTRFSDKFQLPTRSVLLWQGLGNP